MSARPWIAGVLMSCAPPLVEAPTTQVDPPTQTGPGLETTASGDDDDTAAGIRLDAVVPDYGTVGHEVRIQGAGFPADVEVRFDGVPATVLQQGPDELVVEVPDLGPDALAEVTVTSAGSLPFRYFEDGTGRIGVIGTVEVVHHPGSYWVGQDDLRWAMIAFTQPTDAGWEHLFAPAPDTCALEYAVGLAPASGPPLPSITLSDGGTDVVLPADPSTPWAFESNAPAIRAGAAFDLLPMTGDPTWPPIEVPDLTGTIPPRFVVTDPDISQNAWPAVPPAVPLSWAGPYDGDLVVVLVTRSVYSSAAGGWVDEETVSCWLEDDGDFVVPDLWSGWNTTDFLLLRMGRANRPPPDTILPHNGASSGVLGIHWAVGMLEAE